MQFYSRETERTCRLRRATHCGSIDYEPASVFYQCHLSRIFALIRVILVVVMAISAATGVLGIEIEKPDRAKKGMLVQRIKVPFEMRDMDATQLIGTFQNIQVPSTGTSRCADFIRIGQVEPLQTDVGVLYVLPHRFISLPQEGGGEAQCTGTAIDSSVTQESATVLRRDDQITLDRNVTLIDEFALAEERFFIGVELGDRVCGLTRLPNGSPSMWMAPGREISAPLGSAGFVVRFVPGRKYVVYFDETDPCVFAGDAREVGVPTAASSASPSVSPAPLSSPLPSIVPPAGVTSPGASMPSGTEQQPVIPPTLPSFSAVASLGSGRVCFPASASVSLHNGDSIRISDIQLGAIVATNTSFNRNHYLNHDKCTVIGFTHRDANARTWMTKLHVTTNHTLIVSPGHFIYVSRYKNLYDRYNVDNLRDCRRRNSLFGSFRSSTRSVGLRRIVEVGRADSVRVGDKLVHGAHGELATVSRVETVFVAGLYNPQTTCGDLIVDHFLVTTYTAAVGSPLTGHALMTPWRATDRLLSLVGMADWLRLLIASGSRMLCKR